MPVAPPKILMLPKWYPNPYDPWDGNFIENHCIAVSGVADIAVLFVHSDELSGAERLCLDYEREHGFVVLRAWYRRPPALPLIGPLLHGLRYLRAQYAGYRLLRRQWGMPQLCHLHVLTRPALLALALKWFKGIPYVVSEHWSGYHPEVGKYRGWLKKRLTERIARQAFRLMPVSGNLRRSMEAAGLKGQYELVPNVVDTDLFQPGAAAPRSVKRLLHISTLDTVPKNVPALLRVFGRVAARRDDVELHILGDGPMGAQQRALAESLGLKGRVFFYGNVPKAEVARHLQSADAHLMFSLYENQPCVILEAMAAGVPTIASDVGGIAEHLGPDKGILVPSGDEAALEAAIEGVLNGEFHCEPQKLRAYAVQHFSEERIAQRFLAIYLQAIVHARS